MRKAFNETREIRKYFNIDKRIKQLKSAIGQLEEIFYSQNMASRSMAIDGKEIYTVGFRCDTRVVEYVDGIAGLESSIKTLEKKNKYFKDYLNSLEPADRLAITSRYIGEETPAEHLPADVEIYEEIQEIEEAIGYMNGYPRDVQDIDLDNLTENTDSEIECVNAIADLLGV